MTRADQPDTLYSRVIFTPEEFGALTAAQHEQLRADLLAQLHHYRDDLGWTFNDADILYAVSVDQLLNVDWVVVSMAVRAVPYQAPPQPDMKVNPVQERVVGKEPPLELPE